MVDFKNFFNQTVKEKYNGAYEGPRWFKNLALSQEYIMTKNSIIEVLRDVDFSNFIELGPGPGTFTKVILEGRQKVHGLLFDISEEMLRQAKQELASWGDNLEYFNGDFNQIDIDKKFDLFFSCRAIEYLEDKNLMIKKIDKLLNRSGFGVIVTKNPHYLKTWFNHQKNSQHGGEIAAEDLSHLLRTNGLKVIRVSPVIIRFFPSNLLFKLARKLNFILFKYLHSKRMGFLSSLMAESYLILFSK